MNRMNLVMPPANFWQVPEVVNWSIRNRVKLNTDISFTSDCDFPLVVIGEEWIKLVKDAKLLGVTISGDLTWNAHITEVTKNAAKRLYFLVQLKRARVTQKDLCLFYITCVRSVIDYAQGHPTTVFWEMIWNGSLCILECFKSNINE